MLASYGGAGISTLPWSNEDILRIEPGLAVMRKFLLPSTISIGPECRCVASDTSSGIPGWEIVRKLILVPVEITLEALDKVSLFASSRWSRAISAGRGGRISSYSSSANIPETRFNGSDLVELVRLDSVSPGADSTSWSGCDWTRRFFPLDINRIVSGHKGFLSLIMGLGLGYEKSSIECDLLGGPADEVTYKLCCLSSPSKRESGASAAWSYSFRIP